MSTAVLNSSLELAAQRVRFFQVVPNAKTPAVKHFSEEATSDENKIRKMFAETNFNSGIACGRVDHDLYLVGLDIDNKDGRNGYQIIDDLDCIGQEFPDTWSQKTPSGGEHRLFWSPVPIRQGTDVLGRGVDLRGEGGYLVGPGSSIDGKPYTKFHNLPITQCPKWFIEKYQKKDAAVIQLRKTETGVPVNDQVFALKRSISFLRQQPPTLEGSRNDLCYKIVCKIKDFGLDKTQIPDILEEFWDCNPPLERQEIMAAINSAFKYGKNEAGIDAPENIFDAVPEETKEVDFIDKINSEFFFCATNGVSRVCQEKKIDGKFKLERYPVGVFHDKLLPEKTWIKRKNADGSESSVKKQKSKEWMENTRRREYLDIRFIPKKDVSKDIYNTWKGFAAKVAGPHLYSEEAVKGFGNFLKHCKENICANNEKDFEWLMDFVAHMFQKPWEKPQVALVFQGEKGTGKSLFSKVLSRMIGENAISVSNKNYLTNNFNSIMENNILITLEEAFWSGDKAGEGILKTLITDNERLIEHKGEKPYLAAVYDRIIIIGNEDRLVNATMDERRYAVFNVASTRRGDTEFFGEIMDGVMDHGSAELLMSYFMARDISKANVRKAPSTAGLIDQKALSRSEFENWWHESLSEGRLINDFSGSLEWPKIITKTELRRMFSLYFKENSASKYEPSKEIIGKKFIKLAPSCAKTKRVRQEGILTQHYEFCSLEEARVDWETATGVKETWD